MLTDFGVSYTFDPKDYHLKGYVPCTYVCKHVESKIESINTVYCPKNQIYRLLYHWNLDPRWEYRLA